LETSNLTWLSASIQNLFKEKSKTNEKIATFFKVGEEVSYWDDASKKWTYGIVSSTHENRVWIDGIFGVVGYDPEFVELWDVPF
jgi:hypothetical protein